MDINLFDFNLPEELIAQTPSKKRDECRLMVVDREHKNIEHKKFFDIIDYLNPGDVLVRNNTKVIPARLIGEKEATHGHCECLLLKQIEGDVWECLVGGAHSVRVGTVVSFGHGELKATCVEVLPEGIRRMEFHYEGIFLEVLESLGKMPLPPYIKQQISDNSEYQTVYAKVPGSAAAPTAGFHFTNELFDKLKAKGVEVVDITLNIGLGTFRPVKVQDTKDHVMHSELYEISEEAAERLNKAKAEGRRIIAIGTTSVRTLESCFQKYGTFKATREATAIFINPGYEYKAVDALITNFHLPKSTLVMLVSAFMGRKWTLHCYEEAVKEKYRFFSFGDGMFIYGKYDYSHNAED
ncbi:MAG: tRNA preQ1(34) S-adenosylmethionine ribosyltransferase-isomerase QueA [Candidatus Enteromonas sp.]|jgi:S-adenosylmethionine:tRNA ribosyltransferase-isomerase|nr:tRNA preQ1(34) S-adenosylmethionine ribosyltransferase-isomerase QueA [Bacilli bacterium]MBQ2052550.1 tRNA preQ1(34) S-adenosylmethionine ribosyltransferase-isomerase QueA [Bacilli bacterium]MEE3431199.1 tRNA preQ1(34) S-adenosylmethionine ribosyltransferase-isomerase QueA [Candidatus Enteromonas sp.]